MLSSEGDPSPCEALNALKIAELEKRLLMHAAMTEKALEKAADAMIVRMDHANGLIEMMKEQSTLFITRKELAWILVAFLSLVGLLIQLLQHLHK